MPVKPRTTKATAKANRNAIAEAFGGVPVDCQNINFLFARRHLATVHDGRPGCCELQYIVEFDALQDVIKKKLDQIRARDGAKVFEEVAHRLVEGITLDVEIAQGKCGITRKPSAERSVGSSRLET